MTATDELRRMLDERGIEYTTLSYSDATWWTDTNGFDWCYEENCGSTHLTCCSLRITPAQAIAATLGTGTCYDVCDDPNDFTCSECGAHMFIETDDTYTMMTSDENIIKRPNHCPNCGARVVGVRV